MQRVVGIFKSVIMLLVRISRASNQLFIIFSILFESMVCVSSVTEPAECHHHPIIMKKRVKRFLFPQILLLNLNNQGCGCRNMNRYGVGLPYGGGGGWNRIDILLLIHCHFRRNSQSISQKSTQSETYGRQKTSNESPTD